MAFVLLSASLVLAWQTGIPWALGFIALEYLASIFGRGSSIDVSSPLVAAAMLVVAELAYWTNDLRLRSRDERIIHIRRAVLIATLGLAAAAAGMVVLTIIRVVAVRAGLAVEGIGAMALVAALAVIAWLGWRNSAAGRVSS